MKHACGHSLVFDLNRSGQYLPLIWLNNNTINYPGYSHIDGNLQIENIPSAGLGSIQAKWTVKYKSGLRLNTDLREFNIPTDIILTKVQ
jgi:hypothetical protein